MSRGSGDEGAGSLALFYAFATAMAGAGSDGRSEFRTRFGSNRQGLSERQLGFGLAHVFYGTAFFIVGQCHYYEIERRAGWLRGGAAARPITNVWF